MKKFKFEIYLTEDMLKGDEFWENAIKRDGTGIGDLTDCLVECLKDSQLIMGDYEAKDVIRLTKYEE